MVIEIKDIAGVYGSLNELKSSTTLVGDRRLTKPTQALALALEQMYVPDCLANSSNQFRGLVLNSMPSTFPRRWSKDSYYESAAVEEANSPYTPTGEGLYYYYKVYIPELEPRYLNFDDKASLPKAIMTMAEVYMSSDLVQSGMNKRISPGTLVVVQYEDVASVSNPEIIKIGPLLFSVDITGMTPDSEFPFGRPATTLGLVGATGDHNGPGGTALTGPNSTSQQTNAMIAASINTQEPQLTPDAVLKCAAAYDSNNAIPNKSRNDPKIATLHHEFQPYCKCFIQRCHEKDISISLNSTLRSNDWQLQHRRWYIEGDSRQTIMCASAWGEKTTHTTNIRRGSSGRLTGPRKGSFHMVGWAFDFNPTIPMPDGSRKALLNSSAMSLWVNSGIAQIARDIDVRWGGAFNDAIHMGGGPVLSKATNGSLKKGYQVLKAAKKQGVQPNQIDFSSYQTGSAS